MKAKVKGKCGCRLCGWQGVPTDLNEEQDGQIVKCPECDTVLMDFTGRGFVVQNIDCDSLEIS